MLTEFGLELPFKIEGISYSYSWTFLEWATTEFVRMALLVIVAITIWEIASKWSKKVIKVNIVVSAITLVAIILRMMIRVVLNAQIIGTIGLMVLMISNLLLNSKLVTN